MPGLTRSFIARPLPLVREAPFFDEVLGQLQPHHQFADLGPGERELALFRKFPSDEEILRAARAL